jgi:hypothetical protein
MTGAACPGPGGVRSRGSDMTSSGALDLGCSAVAAHRWTEAYERLAEVDTADGLAAPDLELFATAATLRGRSEVAVDALTRAHESYLAGDDAVGAARTAGWIAIELLDGEITRSTSWVSRGMRLAEGLPEPSGGHGARACRAGPRGDGRR